VGALGACTDDADVGSGGATTAASATIATGETAAARAALPPVADDQDLPPQDVSSIRGVYEGALATMGLHLTRATLVDTTDGRFEASSQGRHLALYVEPVAERDLAGYAEDLWTLSALLTPDVFERWPELESYDICQEPVPGDDDADEPPPVTQLDLTREAAERIDWDGGHLADLLVAWHTDPEVVLVAGRDLRRTPLFQEADAQARERTGAAGGATGGSVPPTYS
jgi:hypothetical protein